MSLLQKFPAHFADGAISGTAAICGNTAGFDTTRRRYRTTTRVYNLEVEDFHTYYIGELGVWVPIRAPAWNWYIREKKNGQSKKFTFKLRCFTFHAVSAPSEND